MKSFSKKRNEELFTFLDDYDNEYTFGQEGTLHPEHALTPDEVIGFSSNSVILPSSFFLIIPNLQGSSHLGISVVTTVISAFFSI